LEVEECRTKTILAKSLCSASKISCGTSCNLAQLIMNIEVLSIKPNRMQISRYIWVEEGLVEMIKS